MKHFRSLPAAAAALCLAVAVSAGWLWHTLAETTYEAQARLALQGDPFAEPDTAAGGTDASAAGDSLAEDRVLSAEVLAAACDLLRDRGVVLSLPSPFDSETDYLLWRSRVEAAANGNSDEIRIACTAPGGQEALQMLTALVDAFLAAASAPPPPSASPSDDPEQELRHLLRAVDRQEQKIATLDAEQKRARLAAPAAADADGAAADLDSRLEAAHRAVLDAESRLDGARRDFEKQLPAEIVVTRLPEGPARTKVLDRLGYARLSEELRQHEALAVRSSAIYGRNHPRMIELRERIEQLRRQVAGVAGQLGDVSASTREPDPRAIVLRTLEQDLSDALASAHETESLASARDDRAAALSRFDANLLDARQELAFLHTERDRLQRQTASARREQARRVPAVVQPPTLSPDATGPHAGLPMAVSCVAGMALYLYILRQFRDRFLRPAQAPAASRAAAVPFARAPVQGTAHPAAPAPPLVQIPLSVDPPSRPERSRAQDEQRLARLKMLSTRGSVPVNWE
jgi:hypothetical protein